MTAVDEAFTQESPKQRGWPKGKPRGHRSFSAAPSFRQELLNKDLAEYVGDLTGVEVSDEQVRAVRFALPKWAARDETKALRNNAVIEEGKARLADKRSKLEHELAKLNSTLGELDAH
jgi:hypothetical protein